MTALPQASQGLFELSPSMRTVQENQTYTLQPMGRADSGSLTAFKKRGSEKKINRYERVEYMRKTI